MRMFFWTDELDAGHTEFRVLPSEELSKLEVKMLFYPYLK